MENKNLNDIVIEDADSSKKTQLKNILTLLALLFIILVISIVITKLILGSDEENTDPSMISTSETNNSGDSTISTATAAGAAALAGAGATLAAHTLDDKKETTHVATSSTSKEKTPLLTERNTSSHTKAPLRDHVVKTGETATKKASSGSTSHSSTKKASTYTRPKYVVNKTPVKSHTRTPVKSHTKSSSRSSSTTVTRGYYIKVGAFKDASAAIKNIKSIKLNYKKIKIKGGLTRVLIGPFYSHRDAKNHLAKAKAHVAKDAYITKIK